MTETIEHEIESEERTAVADALDIGTIVNEDNRLEILKYFMMKTKNPDDSEDLTQEVFLRATKHSGSFKPEYKPIGWLRGIAGRVLSDYFADRKKYGISLDDEFSKTLVDHNPSGVDDFLDKTARDGMISDVRTIIGYLPSNLQRFLRLYFFDGKTHPQIAEELQIPMGSVKSGLHRAIKRLRSFYQ